MPPETDNGRKLFLVGAGGHAAGIVDLLTRNGLVISAYVDDHKAAWLEEQGEITHFTDDEKAIGYGAGSVRCVVLGIGGVSPRALKRRLDVFDDYCSAGFESMVSVHPDATVASTASIENGSIVLARAVVQPGVRLGRGVIVNTGSIVEHHARVEKGAHIAPGAVVLGGATVGEYSLIGANAVVLPQAIVPAGSVVPAGETFR